jgi:hypothetical protein
MDTQMLIGLAMFQMGENPLRCTTHDKKGLILTMVLFTLYFDPHKK